MATELKTARAVEYREADGSRLLDAVVDRSGLLDRVLEQPIQELIGYVPLVFYVPTGGLELEVIRDEFYGNRQLPRQGRIYIGCYFYKCQFFNYHGPASSDSFMFSHNKFDQCSGIPELGQP